MFVKTFIIAFLAVGVLAEYKITEEQRQQVKAILTKYCKKNGAEDKAEDVAKAVHDFIDCAKKVIDPETVAKEIEEAKPKGALDEVFKKYCEKSPEMKTCLHTLVTAVTPCVEQSLREQMGAFNNATDSLIDFVCYKDGDRIALFIAEGGPECFREKSNEIRECANKIKEKVPDVDTAKKLTVEDQCAKFDELSSCVVKALEGCSTPTPGNMAEAIFKYVKNGSVCKK